VTPPVSAGAGKAALDVTALPKAELHMHFESSLRPSTVAEWAQRYGRRLPRQGPFDGLGEFVREYEVARDLVDSLDDLRRAAHELVEHASVQGVVWSEVHLIPPTYAGRLGPEEGIVEAVLDGFAAGARDTRSAGRPSAAAIILGINRGLPDDAASVSLDLALRFAGRGVVGLGLAGDEANNPPGRFRDLFNLARDAGLRSLPHAGEGGGPENVRVCVEQLAADRISHGVRAVEDRTVVDLLGERRVCLDVCPSSNVALGIAPSLAEHQLTALIDAGVPVTLNSGGSLFSGATVNDEYRIAHEVLGLDVATLASIARTSIEVSSCAPALTEPALADISSWQGGWTP
jgi:adenosine deaminase